LLAEKELWKGRAWDQLFGIAGGTGGKTRIGVEKNIFSTVKSQRNTETKVPQETSEGGCVEEAKGTKKNEGRGRRAGEN